MGNLIFVAAILGALWWASKSDNKVLRYLSSKYGSSILGILLIAAAGVLFVKGQWFVAIVCVAAGLYFFGWRLPILQRYLGLSASGDVSRFSSELVTLELDNKTGRLDGYIKSGSHKGKRLSQLTESVIQGILNDAVGQRDINSAGLLKAYLDSRSATGRKNTQGDSNAGAGGNSSTHTGTITEKEAYDILGLKPGASIDEIKTAYRTLLKKLHPDHGGSTYLSARINEAKDVLLNRHR
ncbi:J domain-containing protein [Microvirga sp. W0021]|uniref:J domain-containing protein n=1 Tax=Hohaiivirga grylli TaxID=3133970 RepID=A0ABV0BJ56_9HYPH